MTEAALVPPVLAKVVGQPRAVSVLAAAARSPVHAFLFVGPAGSGKRAAALSFAAAMLCPRGGCDDCPVCRDVQALRHPDVIVAERRGASMLVDEAREIGQLAQRTPRLADRLILILPDFHLVDRAAPALLKTIEEPPDTTIFIVLADSIPSQLTTIASRCVPVEFHPLRTEDVVEVLEAEGHSGDEVTAAAAAAHGRLDRARLLVADPEFAQRQARWRSVPQRLDGTGAQVVQLVTELLEDTNGLVEVLREQQHREIEEAQSAAERQGERRLTGRQAMEDRHRREQRRVRSDELRAGLAALADAYRGRMTIGEIPVRRLGGLAKACAAVEAAAEALERNPNEVLLLQALLLELDREA